MSLKITEEEFLKKWNRKISWFNHDGKEVHKDFTADRYSSDPDKIYQELRTLILKHIEDARQNFSVASKRAFSKYELWKKSSETKFSFSGFLIDATFSLIVTPMLAKVVKKAFKSQIDYLLTSGEAKLLRDTSLSFLKTTSNQYKTRLKKSFSRSVDIEDLFKEDGKKFEIGTSNLQKELKKGFQTFSSELMNSTVGTNRIPLHELINLFMSVSPPKISDTLYYKKISNFIIKYDRSVRKLGQTWDHIPDPKFKGGSRIARTSDGTYGFSELKKGTDFPSIISGLLFGEKYKKIEYVIGKDRVDPKDTYSNKHVVKIYKNLIKEVFFLGFDRNQNLGVFSSIFFVSKKKGKKLLFKKDPIVYADGKPLVLFLDYIYLNDDFGILNSIAMNQYFNTKNWGFIEYDEETEVLEVEDYYQVEKI